ncbi:MAG: hypothetical protein AVDCRST_MAG06-3269, partial [uncultured Nocardioides sp.]
WTAFPRPPRRGPAPLHVADSTACLRTSHPTDRRSSRPRPVCAADASRPVPPPRRKRPRWHRGRRCPTTPAAPAPTRRHRRAPCRPPARSRPRAHPRTA